MDQNTSTTEVVYIFEGQVIDPLEKDQKIIRPYVRVVRPVKRELLRVNALFPVTISDPIHHIHRTLNLRITRCVEVGTCTIAYLASVNPDEYPIPLFRIESEVLARKWTIL